MFNFLLGTAFVLMLLAPCVIHLWTRWKKVPELEDREQTGEAGAVMREAKARAEFSLKEPAPFEELAVMKAVPVAQSPEDLYALAVAAGQQAVAARRAARVAAAAAMEAVARAATARAEAAGAAATLAAREAEAATETAKQALATYEQVRGAALALVPSAQRAA